MASTVEHDTLVSNADVHVCKGVNAALQGQFVCADGSGDQVMLGASQVSQVDGISSSSGAITVDLDVGDLITTTLTENITSISFDNVATTPGTRGNAFMWVLTQGGSGSYTITWPASVKWPGATAPTLSTGVGDVDIVTLISPDEGTTWYGFIGGLDFS